MNSSYEKNIVILNVKTSANLFVTRRWVANGGGGLCEKTFIIVAGGYQIDEGGQSDSVEIYDPTDKTWHAGK